MDPKIIAVIIGVIGALLGVYLKEYINAKNERLKAIAILRSNLHLFLVKVQENEHLGKLLMAGSILDDRYIKSITSGDNSKYNELLEQIESIEKKADSEELLTDDAVKELCNNVKSVSKKEMEIVFNEIDRIREDIDHGTFILGRSSIDKLNIKMIHRVLQVKRSLNDIFLTIKLILAAVYEREEVDPVYIKSQALGTIKEAVFACRHVLPLLKMCNEELED